MAAAGGLEDLDLAGWKQFSFFEPSESRAVDLTVNLPEGHPSAPKKVSALLHHGMSACIISGENARARHTLALAPSPLSLSDWPACCSRRPRRRC